MPLNRETSALIADFVHEFIIISIIICKIVDVRRKKNSVQIKVILYYIYILQLRIPPRKGLKNYLPNSSLHMKMGYMDTYPNSVPTYRSKIVLWISSVTAKNSQTWVPTSLVFFPNSIFPRPRINLVFFPDIFPMTTQVQTDDYDTVVGCL